MAQINNSARLELAEGLKHDMHQFWLIESMRSDYTPTYKSIFTSRQAPTGDEGVANSALLNVRFKETGPKESVEHSDPSQGRRFPYKLKRFTAAMNIERDLVDKDAAKPALQRIIQEWVNASRKKLNVEQEIFYFKAFNKGGLTAGDSHFNQSGREFLDTNLMYDGKPLFNLTGNSRTLLNKPDNVASNAFYNSLAASGLALNATQFNNAKVLMMSTNSYADDGDPEPIIPTHLIYNPALSVDAFQVLRTASGLPGDVNHGANPFYNSVMPIETQFITDTTSWFLFSKDPNTWIAYDLEAPIFDFWFDQHKKCYWVSIDVRYGYEIRDWRRVVAANAATS